MTGLNWQKVPLVFDGADNTDDPRLGVPAKYAVADNVVFDEHQTPVERGGQTSINVLAAGLTAPCRRLFTHEKQLMMETESGEVWRLNQSGVPATAVRVRNGVVNAEPDIFVRSGVQETRLVGLGTASTSLSWNAWDWGLGNNTLLVVWAESILSQDALTLQLAPAPVVRFSLRSLTTGVEVARGQLDNAGASGQISGIRIRWNPASAQYFVTWRRQLAGLTPSANIFTSSITETGIATSHGSAVADINSVAFDVAPVPLTGADTGRIFVFWAMPGAVNQVRVRVLDSAGAFVSTSNLSIVAPGGETVRSLAATLTSNNSKPVLAIGVREQVQLTKCPGGTFTAAAVIYTNPAGPAAAVNPVGKVVFSNIVDSASANAHLIIETKTAYKATAIGAGEYLRVVQVADGSLATWTSLGTLHFRAPCALAGELFTVGTRVAWPIQFQSNNLQSVVLVVDFSGLLRNIGAEPSTVDPDNTLGAILGRFDYAESSYPQWLTAFQKSGVVVPSAYPNRFCTTRFEGNPRTVGAVNDTEAHVSLKTFDVAAQLNHVELNGTTYLPGACPLLYDGVNVTEEHFHFGLEIIESEAAAVPLPVSEWMWGPFNAGSATYALAEAWQDAKGNWHQSALSNQVTLTTTVSNTYVRLPFRRPPSMRKNRKVLLYRTRLDSSDATLYLCSEQNGNVVSDDAVLTGGEPAPTTGGRLAPTPAPACHQFHLYQFRLFSVSPDKLCWTKETSLGYGAEFVTTDLSHLRFFPAEYGRGVGVEQLGDMLAVFGESRIGLLYGNGPDDRGVEGGYPPLQTRIAQYGARWDNHRSIILSSQGIWFFSPFGLRLLTTDGNLAPVGPGVDVYTEGVSRVFAVSSASREDVRFYLSSGVCLVYSTMWGRFSRFLQHASADAAFAGGRYYHMQGTLLRYYDEASSVDVNDAGANAVIPWMLETNWLSFAGPLGFQRVRDVGVLAVVENAVGSVDERNITASAAYDYEEGGFSTQLALSALNPLAGTDSYGRDRRLLQYDFKLTRQKAASMKLRLTGQTTAVAANQGKLRLSAILLTAGLKRGIWKGPRGY